MGFSIPNSYPRISARRGQVVDLDIDFFHSGVLADPYAIRRVEIYKTQVLPHNIVASIPVVAPGNLYPAPIVQETLGEDNSGSCGTEYQSTDLVAGKYHLPYWIPNDFSVPDVYYDVWYYFAENPCEESEGTDITDCDLDDPQYEPYLLKCCKNFWIYPDEWACSNKLQTVKFGFEPLDQKFYQPEIRPLEVGIMPLPLYSYNYNLVTPMIPFIRPTITVKTQHHELLLENEPCRIGIRQGPFRSNPWVVQYDLDTSRFYKGTYKFQITLGLPTGGTRTSREFIFTVM